MPIWNATSVEEVPAIELAGWEVFEVSSPKNSEIYDRHFVGYNLTESEGRVSSRIVTFDKESKIGTTRSGRKYKLVGDPGLDDTDASFTFNGWLALNKISEYKIVSEEYIK